MVISPDGRYWWDGTSWVDFTPSAGPPGIPPASSTPPSGMRGLLIGTLLVSDLLTGLLALFGLLTTADFEGWLGNPRPDPPYADAGAWVLIVVFELLFVITVAATVCVMTRTRWARAAGYIAGAALSLTCPGLVLAVPIFHATARADLGARPSPYALPGSSA